MPISRRSLMFIAPLSLLAACTDSTPATAAGLAAAVASNDARPTLTEIKTKAKYFEVGSMMAATQINVFFDPQCPHCGSLWNEIKPLLPKARFRWIPVALMNKKSMGQGAAILLDADPVKAMEAHELLLLAKKGGLDTGTPTPAIAAAITVNSELLSRLGVQSIPYMIGANARTGVEVVIPGGMAAQGIAAKFGISL